MFIFGVFLLLNNNSEETKYSAFHSVTPGNKNLENLFLDWFIGFTEGDGSFQIFTDSGNKRLCLMLNQADLNVLNYIQKQFGFGNVTTFSQPNPKTGEISTYELSAICALIELFNGNLHLQKVQSRFSRWVELYNTQYLCSEKRIILKIRKSASFITLKNGWLSGFFEAEGGFYAGLDKSPRSASNLRLRLRAFIDQKGEKDVLQHIASLLKVKNVSIRDEEKQYYQVEISSKIQLEILLNYLNVSPLRGKKRLVFTLWEEIFYFFVQENICFCLMTVKNVYNCKRQ